MMIDDYTNKVIRLLPLNVVSECDLIPTQVLRVNLHEFDLKCKAK